jgi:hypothetical protein
LRRFFAYVASVQQDHYNNLAITLLVERVVDEILGDDIAP